MTTNTEYNRDTSLAVYMMTHGPECTYIPDYCIPMEIGAACRDNFRYNIKDNIGDNISYKDKVYSELTGLYWLWKNDNHEFVGLYHYRRYFNIPHKKIVSTLDKKDVIVGIQYKLPNVDTDYIEYSGHIESDWELLKTILQEDYNEYYPTFIELLSDNKIYACNMFISNRSFLNSYCEWLFPLLSKIEEKISLEGRTESQKRVIGYLAERLFYLYVLYHKLNVEEVPITNIAPYFPITSLVPAKIRVVLMKNKNRYQKILNLQSRFYIPLNKLLHPCKK